ncbi:MAG: cob(I)yrinic acid a,c-diamide adenosyltransferase [Chloroflexota bacterium]
MKIYTKTGDDGTTGLLNGERVKKSSLRVETYGAADELNAAIGFALAVEVIPEKLSEPLVWLSHKLFNLGSDFAAPLDPAPKFEVIRIADEDVAHLEGLIDKFQEELPPLRKFILPGGSELAARLHLARTICRRAERFATRLADEERINDRALVFLNRASDFLFSAARMANYEIGREDIFWEK